MVQGQKHHPWHVEIHCFFLRAFLLVLLDFDCVNMPKLIQSLDYKFSVVDIYTCWRLPGSVWEIWIFPMLMVVHQVHCNWHLNFEVTPYFQDFVVSISTDCVINQLSEVLQDNKMILAVLVTYCYLTVMSSSGTGSQRNLVNKRGDCGLNQQMTDEASRWQIQMVCRWNSWMMHQTSHRMTHCSTTPMEIQPVHHDYLPLNAGWKDKQTKNL